MNASASGALEELDSWRCFAECLEGDDRARFTEVLGLCREYLPAIQARWSPFPTEALFMSILLAQHAAIVRLCLEARKLEAGSNARLDI